MKLGSFKKLAVLSTAVMGAVFCVHDTMAATINSGDATTINITATVLNTFNVTADVTMDFGTLAIVPSAANQATATITAAASPVYSTVVGGAGYTDARIIRDTTSTVVDGDITLTGLGNTNINITYGNVQDLKNGAATLKITELTDNLVLPTQGQAGTSGDWTSAGGTITAGVGKTTVGGTLEWKVGGTIQTTQAATAYPSGSYTGSFDVTLSY